jgi:PAS domain S-box-containing protein
MERQPLIRALHGEQMTADDIELDRSDRRVPLEVWSSPIFDEQGNIPYAVTVFEDITGRRRVEEELSRHREHLEELVEERTVELQEEFAER